VEESVIGDLRFVTSFVSESCMCGLMEKVEGKKYLIWDTKIDLEGGEMDYWMIEDFV
jgi:hypothetical protein